MEVNYNELSKKYDTVRKENVGTIARMLENLSISKDTNILDFGCGTGNFTCAIKSSTNANVFGVEPSDGMREKAIEKSPDIMFKKGDHEKIPYKDGFFDFVYMTDVIHHVPDIDKMFREIYRVLKKAGHLCIVTESHRQLETRFWVRYFPTTVEVEKRRYPDICEIVELAKKNGYTHSKNDVTDSYKTHKISPDFLKLVENKGYSMFHLINKSDYAKGLSRIKDDYNHETALQYNHGETFIWLQK